MGQVSNIAVVGAGIGGLAAASLLRDQGHRVTIYDQFAAPQPLGSGLILQPAAQPVLAQLGILGAARGYGVRISGLEGHAHPGNQRVLTASYAAGDAAGHQGLAMHRGALFQLLLKAAEQRQVEIRPANFVLSAVQDSGGVYLRIEGSRQAGPYEMVVDAGGANSPLSPLVSRALAYGALWGVVDLPEGERDLGGLLRQRYVAARKMAGVLPIGSLPGDPAPKAAVFWSLKASEFPDWAEADIEDWKAEASRLWPDFGVLVQGITRHSELTFAAYRHGSLTWPCSRRVVHVGDAWHQASPQLGQGANLALLDAAVLAECLRTRSGIDAALSAYARRRLLHVKAYQALSLVATPMYQSSGTFWAALRDRVVAPMLGRPSVRSMVSRVISGRLVGTGLMAGAQMPEQAAGEILHEPGE